MPRRPKAGEKLEKDVHVRLTETTYNVLKHYLAQRGLKLADYVRALISQDLAGKGLLAMQGALEPEEDRKLREMVIKNEFERVYLAELKKGLELREKVLQKLSELRAKYKGDEERVRSALYQDPLYKQLKELEKKLDKIRLRDEHIGKFERIIPRAELEKYFEQHKQLEDFVQRVIAYVSKGEPLELESRNAGEGGGKVAVTIRVSRRLYEALVAQAGNTKRGGKGLSALISNAINEYFRSPRPLDPHLDYSEKLEKRTCVYLDRETLEKVDALAKDLGATRNLVIHAILSLKLLREKSQGRSLMSVR